MRKSIKPISALSTTRTRLGITQEEMALQLGISHSMIKMIETGRRFLSSDGLVKLAALEIRLTAKPSVNKGTLPACVKELYENDHIEYAVQTSDHEIDCNYKARLLERKLQKMESDHEDIISCLHSIEAVLEVHPDDKAENELNLWVNRSRLLQKLSRCTPQQQAILKNKIAMLYAEVSLKKSIHPRYVHTNEKPIIF